MSQKYDTKWIKLKDVYLNINAISKVTLYIYNKIIYVHIYTGNNTPEIVEVDLYNHWVKENNLNLPTFEETNYE